MNNTYKIQKYEQKMIDGNPNKRDIYHKKLVYYQSAGVNEKKIFGSNVYNFIKLNIDSITIPTGASGSNRRSSFKGLLAQLRVAIDKYSSSDEFANCTDENVIALKDRMNKLIFRDGYATSKYPELTGDEISGRAEDEFNSERLMKILNSVLLLCCKIFINNSCGINVASNKATTEDIASIRTKVTKFIDEGVPVPPPQVVADVAVITRDIVDSLPIYKKYILKNVESSHDTLNEIYNKLRTIMNNKNDFSELQDKFEDKFVFFPLMNKIEMNIDDLKNKYVIPDDILYDTKKELTKLSSTIQNIYDILYEKFDLDKTEVKDSFGTVDHLPDPL